MGADACRPAMRHMVSGLPPMTYGKPESSCQGSVNLDAERLMAYRTSKVFDPGDDWW
jgi:hypothetical protein